MNKILNFVLSLNTIFISALVSAVVSTLVSLYASRKKITVHASFLDNNEYSRISLSPTNAFLAIVKPHLRLSKPPENCESYQIINLIISNHSPKPVSIQKLTISDENNTVVNPLNWFNVQIANHTVEIPEKVTLTTMFDTKSNFVSFEDVDLFKRDHFVVPPHESKIINLAIESNINNLKVKAITTDTNFFLIRYCGTIINKIRFYCEKEEKCYLFKSFQTKVHKGR